MSHVEVVRDATGKCAWVAGYPEQSPLKYSAIRELGDQHQQSGVTVTTEIGEVFKAPFRITCEEMAECKFCSMEFPAGDMHFHQGSFVCGGCWDERLRITE